MAEKQRPLLVSPSLQEESTPKLSSKASSESYVLQIANLSSAYAASSSAPSNVIDLFDKATLRRLQTLSGHEEATTCLKTAVNLGGVVHECLVSSGKDGCVKAWDNRSNSHSIKMTNLGNSKALLCCDITPDGLTVAAGTELKADDAQIFYWDPRQPATPIRTHSEIHSDDITAVCFRPERNAENNHNMLLSASSDGLLSLSDADQDDEDEANLFVGNWGSSISQAGWIQGASKGSPARIWASTDIETFGTWSGELDQLMNLDIRSPILHGTRTWVTDYLITAHSTTTSTPALSIFTGSNEGDIALISNTNASSSDAPWCLHKQWTHGHSGVVRSLLWDERNQVLVTGGEDSRLNAWPINPITSGKDEAEEGDDANEDEKMDVDEDLSMASPNSKARKRDLDSAAGRKGKRAKRD